MSRLSLQSVMKPYLVAAMLTMGSASIAQASHLTGADIMKGCEALATGHVEHLDPATSTEVSQCFGAVIAIEQTMLARKEYCPPHTISNGDLFKAVYTYMQKNNANLDAGYGIIIFKALQNAWPCEDKSQ